MSDYNCYLRPVARNVYHINISITFRHDVQEVYCHIILHRRLATYHKFLIDRWENVCDYFAGRNRGSTLVTTIIWENLKKQGNLTTHACPYRANETISIHAPRISEKLLEFPLLPSGDFRAHFYYASGPGPNGKFYMEMIMHFGISDHRVWQ